MACRPDGMDRGVVPPGADVLPRPSGPQFMPRRQRFVLSAPPVTLQNGAAPVNWVWSETMHVMAPPVAHRHQLGVGKAVSVWWAVATFFAGEHLLGYNLHRNPEITWWGAVLSQFLMATAWGLVTPQLFRETDRFINEPRRWRRLTRAVLIGLAICLVFSAVRTVLHDYEHTPATRPCSYGGLASMIKYLHVDLLLFAAVFAIGLARRYAQQRADQQARTLAVESQLTAARLQALQVQLNPHFLFNALNTVSALVESDPPATRAVVARLSELLRRGLDAAQLPETRLADEVHFIRAYLQIMEVRFRDRLQVTLEVAAELDDALVPAFILQLLVENAFEHGISRILGPGRLAIRLWRAANELHLQVRDNGPGPSDDIAGRGIGLANISARLEQLYPGRSSLRLDADSPRGAIATVVLPYQVAAEASS
jgi:two-component system, LytTR family, sensor kinase